MDFLNRMVRCAVVVHAGQIITEAAAQLRAELYITGHAELVALRCACQALSHR